MHEMIKRFILSKIDLNYGRLSLCDLNNYRVQNFLTRRYQVHSDDRNFKYSKCHENLDDAIQDFIRLTQKVKTPNVCNK